MGRPRKISSPAMLKRLWMEYKEWCNNQEVMTHEFSQRNSEFVSKRLKHATTYTIEGFCVYIGMSRSTFYSSYADNENYSDIVTVMREECETDARMKFELGVINPKLAPLWMSKHGYSVKTDTEIQGGVPVIISGEDDLKD